MRNVRSTGPLWAVKTGYIVVSALFCVLGVVLFITAERCVPWIGRALGIGMVICGAIKLGGYFSKDLFRLAFQYDLAFGILLIAVGIITLCHPGEAMTFLCVMFGIPVLADGLFKDNQTLEYFAVPHSDKFTTIGAEAFEGLKKLTVLCDASLIPEESFADCVSLADVRLSAGATDAQIAD